MAGYLVVLATLSVITQVLFFVGATSRDDFIEHGPDSDQVFLPVETLRTKRVRSVFDFFATTVFKTVNPGRATIFVEELLVPAEV